MCRLDNLRVADRFQGGMDSCEVSNRVSISSGPMELHATVKRPGRDANHSLSLEVMKIMCLFINLLLVFKYIYIYNVYKLYEFMV